MKAKNKIIRSRKFAFNAYEHWHFAIIKNRKVILRNIHEEKPRARDCINPTDARQLIGWLASYLNWSDPTTLTEAIARTKANTRSINRQIDIVAKECEKP